MSSENAERINADAAAWLARRASGDWSEEDEAGLSAWLELSDRHRVAYLRVEYVWREAARLKALSAGVSPGEVPPPHEWHRSPFAEAQPPATSPEQESMAPVPVGRRGPGAGWPLKAAAAALLATGCIALLWWAVLSGSTYQTPVGAVETVSMRDGSLVTLNTDSRIQVALSDKERLVELKRGEAFFEVAKDPHRPFVVHAGEAWVTAVGTQFSVRRDDEKRVEVVVTEGVVRIKAQGASPEGSLQRVEAGEVARIGEGSGVLIQEESAPKAEEDLSWRRGILIFRDVRLSDAVAEFNRYNTRQIRIADPALNEFHVAGSFKATSSAAFVNLLGQGFPIEVVEKDDGYVLLPRR